MSKTIMAVGAHTGDAQLTCGMLLAKHAMNGDRVVIVDLTAGERGTPAGWSVSDFRAYNTVCRVKMFICVFAAISFNPFLRNFKLVHLSSGITSFRCFI